MSDAASKGQCHEALSSVGCPGVGPSSYKRLYVSDHAWRFGAEEVRKQYNHNNSFYATQRGGPLFKDHEIQHYCYRLRLGWASLCVSFGDFQAIFVWIEKDAPRAGLVPSKIDGLTLRSG